MEVMDKKKKDRLIKGIVLNTLVLVGCIIYVIMVIWPKYTDINATIDKTNAISAHMSSLEKNGVDKDSFADLLKRLGKTQEVPENTFADSAKLNTVLAKPATVTKDYLSWLLDESAKLSTLDKEIQQNDQILGNIIPVFLSPSLTSSDTEIDNRITLASFISYVEKDILGKYTLTSYAPLGIANITFPDKTDTPINI